MDNIMIQNLTDFIKNTAGLDSTDGSVNSNEVPDALKEFLDGSSDTLGKYFAVSRAAVIIVAVVAAVLVLAIIFLIYKNRMAKPAAAPEPETVTAPEAKKPRMEEVGSLRVGKLHEQGARSSQQDSFGVSDESLIKSHGFLAVVADGMGGLSEGDKVSQAAVGAILDCFALYPSTGTPEQQLLLLARQSVGTVNSLLGPSGFRKSGSTLVMGLIRNSFFSFLSIGDSRICLYRDGILLQLNREHVYKNKLALNAINNTLPLQDVYTHPKKEGLTSFLGMGVLEQADMPAGPIRILPGDRILLMSDGVYNALPEHELAAALDGTSCDEAVDRLREAIRAKGYVNQDNYTAVVIECGPSDTVNPVPAAGAAPVPVTSPESVPVTYPEPVPSSWTASAPDSVPPPDSIPKTEDLPLTEDPEQ